MTAPDVVTPISPNEPAVGTLVDRYRILAKLGQGAMSSVFRAEHVGTGKVVALKWLTAKSAAAQTRLLREAQATARVHHPNLVDIYDVGSAAGSLFLVMEVRSPGPCDTDPRLQAHGQSRRSVLTARRGELRFLRAVGGTIVRQVGKKFSRDIPVELFQGGADLELAVDPSTSSDFEIELRDARGLLALIYLGTDWIGALGTWGQTLAQALVAVPTMIGVLVAFFSANTRGIATTDAGFKALSTGAPRDRGRRPAGVAFMFMGDEHGALIDPTLAHSFHIADGVRLVVPHCDPTVNLYDAYHVVSGDTLVEIWPVSARGRSR